MKNTTVGVDLAKDVIQVCVYANKKVHSNTEMTHHDFLEWLFKTHSTTIVFED
jgi:transposase